MKLLCKMFGHTRHKGWWGDGLYGDVGIGQVDGIGRTHFEVRSKCDRCGQRYTLARFHGSRQLGRVMLGQSARG